MTRLVSGLAALVILAGLSVSATADDWEDCKRGEPERRIAACTQIIGKGGANEGQALAHTNRGDAYYVKGDHDRAIADHSTAVEFDPKYSDAYINRGNAYNAKGDRERAMADYTKAIEISPSHSFAYYNRGNVHAAKGDHDRAIADYNSAIRLNPKYVHWAIGADRG